MKKKDNKGFSLIELIIAIAILVILTGLLAPQFMRYMERAREAKDMQALDTLYSATQAAMTDEDAYGEMKKTSPGGIFAKLASGSLTLSEIEAASEVVSPVTDLEKLEKRFSTEILTTIGKTIAWSSKSVTGAGGNDVVRVFINKDFKVFAWIGTANTGTTDPAETLALSPTSAANATQATTFFISK